MLTLTSYYFLSILGEALNILTSRPTGVMNGFYSHTRTMVLHKCSLFSTVDFNVQAVGFCVIQFLSTVTEEYVDFLDASIHKGSVNIVALHACATNLCFSRFTG